MEFKEVKSKNEFKEALEESEKKPVLVDFWAEWCLPCKRLGKELEKVEGFGTVLYKINIDEMNDLAQELQVRNIPHVKLYKDGKEADSFSGVKKSDEVVDWIEERV